MAAAAPTGAEKHPVYGLLFAVGWAVGVHVRLPPGGRGWLVSPPAIAMDNLATPGLSIATRLQKGSAIVSHYTVEELIARWKREELTTEQLLGQLLLVLREHEQRLKELARQVPAMPEPPR